MFKFTLQIEGTQTRNFSFFVHTSLHKFEIDMKSDESLFYFNVKLSNSLVLDMLFLDVFSKISLLCILLVTLITSILNTFMN